MAKIDYGKPFKETATGTTSATASHAAVSGKKYHITDMATSSDLAGSICLVKDGTTTIWQQIVGTTRYEQHFEPALEGTTGNLVSAEITGTAACKANIAGFELP